MWNDSITGQSVQNGTGQEIGWARVGIIHPAKQSVQAFLGVRGLKEGEFEKNSPCGEVATPAQPSSSVFLDLSLGGGAHGGAQALLHGRDETQRLSDLGMRKSSNKKRTQKCGNINRDLLELLFHSLSQIQITLGRTCANGWR